MISTFEEDQLHRNLCKNQHSRKIFVPKIEDEIDPKTSENETTKSASESDLDFLRYRFPEPITQDSIIIYIGPESKTLTNIHMRYSGTRIHMYDPESKTIRLDNSGNNKLLMRRYYLVQRAKDADVIGIVLGTLGAGKIYFALHGNKVF